MADKARVLHAKIYKKSDDPRYKQGSVVSRVSFYEDSSKSTSGFITGNLTSDFCIDKKGKIYYDALMFAADGYANNQCRATRTGYKTKKSKKMQLGGCENAG